jgi:CheY-like chemotaxis protein
VQAAEHCADLTKSLLAFARRAPLATEVLPASRIVEQVAGLLRSLLPSTIAFTVDQASDLPTVTADPTQLQQILLNLVINARDALEGDGTIVLSVRSREILRPSHEDAAPGLYVEFAVRDDGVGMDEEVQRRIFDPFFTTKDLHEGTGLGLAVAYGAARSHGGWVEVDSAPGEGSTFRVLLPASSEMASPAPALSVAERPEGRERILVADDEQTLRRLVVRVLGRAGYETIEAVDGLDVIQAFERAPEAIDLVLLDVTMPHVDGFEALRQIRAIRPDVPAILVSGLLGFDAPELEHPRTEFLPKPYDLRQLAAAVRRVLDSDA